MANITRKEFLKGTAAGALSLMAAGVLGKTALADEAGTYKPGTYSATATGMGEVTVTMTFDAENITDVQIDVSNETEGIGADIGDEMAQAILDAQGFEIDNKSGASITSNAIKQAAEACIAQAKNETVETGAVPAEEEKTWRTKPDPIPDDEIAEEYDTDVAIIGLGYAGLMAYRELAEEGADVMAVEAMERDSWWTVGHDIGHINSKFLESRGVPKVDEVEFLNNWMLQSHNKPNAALVMKFAHNCGETIDWFLDVVDPEIVEKAHISFWPDNEYTIHELNNGLHYYTGTAQWWEAQWEEPGTLNNNTPGQLEVKDLTLANLEYVEENFDNAQAFFGTRGCQLIQDDNGKVTGVIAQKSDGTYIRINAKKGVVLSGGGFAANPEMCRDLLPHLQANLLEGEMIMGPMGRDGSTIQMGVWAGGHLEGEISTMNFDSLSVPDNIAGILWVDDNGERFQNEAFAGPEVGGFFAARAKRRKITSVYDSTWPTQILRGYCGHGAFDYSVPENVEMLSAKFEAAIDAGPEGADGYYCAETIEELAEYIGVDVDTFKATIERYNELCEAGVDSDFGKDPRYLNPVKEGPFFAHVTTPSLGFGLVTTGGFVTTNNQQVLDDQLEPIEGLYASGNTCGMRFGSAYITPIPGVSIGMALTLGRELGKYLAKL